MIVANEAIATRGMKPENTRVAIQGFGNVGSMAAFQMRDQGYKIVGVSDMYGAIYNANGLDIDKLYAYARENNQVVGFPEGDAVDRSAILTCPCDVLLPAATENQITTRNADRI